MNYKEEILNALTEVCKKARKEGFLDGQADGYEVAEKIANEAEYKRGYDDGVKDGHTGKISELLVDTYEQGLSDAWECAKKIALAEKIGGLSNKEMYQIFNFYAYDSVLTRYSASEAIVKIEEYEEKQKAEKSCRNCKRQIGCLEGEIDQSTICDMWQEKTDKKSCFNCEYGVDGNDSVFCQKGNCIDYEFYKPKQETIMIGDEN